MKGNPVIAFAETDCQLSQCSFGSEYVHYFACGCFVALISVRLITSPPSPPATVRVSASVTVCAVLPPTCCHRFQPCCHRFQPCCHRFQPCYHRYHRFHRFQPVTLQTAGLSAAHCARSRPGPGCSARRRPCSGPAGQQPVRRARAGHPGGGGGRGCRVARPGALRQDGQSQGAAQEEGETGEDGDADPEDAPDLQEVRERADGGPRGEGSPTGVSAAQ